MENSLNSPTPQFIQAESERLKKEGAGKNLVQLLTNVFGPEAVSRWMKLTSEKVGQEKTESKTT